VELQSPILRELLEYWKTRRATNDPPLRSQFDPTELRRQVGRLHLLDVRDGGVFRYRLYGSLAANPDGRDMTGRTTRDYDDGAFGELVTEHLSACVQARGPLMHRIKATVDGEPYEYEKVVVPLSSVGGIVDMLMVGIDYVALPRTLRHGRT
jgi:hypothetical protein